MTDTEVLEYIKQFKANNGYTPSYGEIADHFRSWKSAVHGAIHGLVDSGQVTLVKPARCPIVVNDE